MTIQEARKILQDRYPSRVIKASGDYDKDHFVFSAIDPKEIEAKNIGQYFSVRKDSGAIEYFTPDNIIDLITCFKEGAV